ncbi:hypothetical protein GGE65_008015 [Skermanella aerolata]|uniref:hypothetical protein n=1 Tax=Skermanella aerolata TaxID=393310 RepID=UPI003D1E6A28
MLTASIAINPPPPQAICQSNAEHRPKRCVTKRRLNHIQHPEVLSKVVKAKEIESW